MLIQNDEAREITNESNVNGVIQKPVCLSFLSLLDDLFIRICQVVWTGDIWILQENSESLVIGILKRFISNAKVR